MVFCPKKYTVTAIYQENRLKGIVDKIITQVFRFYLRLKTTSITAGGTHSDSS